MLAFDERLEGHAEAEGDAMNTQSTSIQIEQAPPIRWGLPLADRRPEGVLPQGVQLPPRLVEAFNDASAFSPVQGLVMPGLLPPPMPHFSLPSLPTPPQGANEPPPLGALPTVENSAKFDPSMGFRTWGEKMLTRIQGGGDHGPPVAPPPGIGGLEKWEVPIFKPVASCPHMISPQGIKPFPSWVLRDTSSPSTSSPNSTPGKNSGSSTPSFANSSTSQLNRDFARTLQGGGPAPLDRSSLAPEASPGRGGMLSGRRASAAGGGEALDAQMQMPQSVLKIVARALQADLIIAAILQRPTRLAETVLCVPEGLVTVPVRLSKGVLDAATGQVTDTEKLLLPSMLTAALGARPQRLLASQFAATGCEGICYAMWIKEDSVPQNAAELMADTVQVLPAFLTSRVQAMSTERLSRRFDAILKRMPQGVVFIDDGLGPCLVNPAAAELLNLPTFGEVDPVKVAATMHELAVRSDMRAEVYRWFNAVAGNPNEIIESDWVLKSPRQVLRVRSYPVGGPSNQLMSLGIESLVPDKQKATHGRVWLFDDVTAERDARDAIEAADRAKSQFLAMMSHELRTPLTGVLGMLDLLRLTQLTSEQGKYVRAMQGSAESLLTIINDILDFSKIEAGHLTLEQIDFHLSTLLEQVGALFQGKLEEKKLKLALDLPPSEEMVVKGDPVRLRQVFANLVANAIKFTEVGGISISIRKVSSAQGTRGTKRERSGQVRSSSLSPRGLTIKHSGLSRGASSSRRPSQLDLADGQSSANHDATPGRPSRPEPINGETSRRASTEPSETLAESRAKLPRRSALGRQIAGLTVEVTDDSGGSPKSDGPEEGAGLSTSGGEQLPGLKSPLNREKSRFSRQNRTCSEGHCTTEEERLVDKKRRGSETCGGSSTCLEGQCKVQRAPGLTLDQGVDLAGGSTPHERENGAGGSGRRTPTPGEGPGLRERNGFNAEGTRINRRGSLSASFGGGGGMIKRSSGQALQEQEERVWFEIRVTDTGIGLTKEQQGKLFSPFIQADCTTTRKFGGTGLGLAICKRLVKAMGGDIWVTSDVGVGSTFAFTVGLRAASDPEGVLLREGRATEARPSTAPPEKVKKASRICKVLVAEDNPINQMLIGKMLKHYGHEITIVGNGQLAVDEIVKKPFYYTLILMDLQMPVLDGLSATRAIRALGFPGELPIFALTADVLVGSTFELEEHGLDGYLTKPINWEKLSNAIEGASNSYSPAEASTV